MKTLSAAHKGRDLDTVLGDVVIVGGGRMGQALCAGLCKKAHFDSRAICVVNPGVQKRQVLQASFNVRTTEDITNLDEAFFNQIHHSAQTVIFALKPDIVIRVARQYCELYGTPELVISVAAGVELASYKDVFGAQSALVRIMPNMPIVCAHATSALSFSETVPQSLRDAVSELFGFMGDVLVLDESLQNVACAISGSGPAYYELIVHTIAQTGEKLGLSSADAKFLALHTMLGTAQMLVETDLDLQQAIDAVTSPGGTTYAAFETFKNLGLCQALEAGVTQAASAAAELGKKI